MTRLLLGQTKPWFLFQKSPSHVIDSLLNHMASQVLQSLPHVMPYLMS